MVEVAEMVVMVRDTGIERLATENRNVSEPHAILVASSAAFRLYFWRGQSWVGFQDTLSRCHGAGSQMIYHKDQFHERYSSAAQSSPTRDHVVPGIFAFFRYGGQQRL